MESEERREERKGRMRWEKRNFSDELEDGQGGENCGGDLRRREVRRRKGRGELLPGRLLEGN